MITGAHRSVMIIPEESWYFNLNSAISMVTARRSESSHVQYVSMSGLLGRGRKSQQCHLPVLVRVTPCHSHTSAKHILP